MINLLVSKKFVVVLAVSALIGGAFMLLAETPVAANTALSCQLTWYGETLPANNQYGLPAGTGVRHIGQGSNWSINVTGLQPNQQFRLANTNLTHGGTTYNNILTADQNGNFSLSDNTTIQGYEYAVGIYQTMLEVIATGMRVNCSPSFIIVDDTPVPTPTPVLTSTPTY